MNDYCFFNIKIPTKEWFDGGIRDTSKIGKDSFKGYVILWDNSVKGVNLYLPPNIEESILKSGDYDVYARYKDVSIEQIDYLSDWFVIFYPDHWSHTKEDAWEKVKKQEMRYAKTVMELAERELHRLSGNNKLIEDEITTVKWMERYYVDPNTKRK
jgi:hypothetical protein